MRLKAALIFCLLAGLAITVSGLAQEGHPLTGVWYGDYGTGTANRAHLTDRNAVGRQGRHWTH